MSVKPDVMEGVPEEPGMYYCLHNEVQPKVVWVYKSPRYPEKLEARFWDDTMVLENKFDNHKWSEKIEPPEPDQ